MTPSTSHRRGWASVSGAVSVGSIPALPPALETVISERQRERRPELFRNAGVSERISP
jgi:hypothetical protein